MLSSFKYLLHFFIDNFIYLLYDQCYVIHVLFYIETFLT